MSEVYVLTDGAHDESYIVGAFATLEWAKLAAQQLVNAQAKREHSPGWVIDWEADAGYWNPTRQSSDLQIRRLEVAA